MDLNVDDEVFTEIFPRKRGKKRNARKRTNKQPLPSVNTNGAPDSTNSIESPGDSKNENESDDCGTELSDEFDNCTLKDAENNTVIDGIMKSPPKISAVADKQEEVHSPEIYSPKIQGGDESIITTEFNRRALSQHALTYELEKFEKNALIIINQENIDGYERRRGTEKDVEALQRTFEKFGFEVVEHKDFTKDEVFTELKAFSERDFTDYGCVAVAVLTHGSSNGLLRAKDQQYSEIEIINHFKVTDKPTLVTKPKILLIQACRGTRSMRGVPVFHSGKIRKDLDEELEPYILPVESDMLILHSSYIGNSSHRDELHGSWFIQSLCNQIDKLSSTLDLQAIITKVQQEVAINKSHKEYNRRTFETDINKQMPVLTSTLIRKLYLKMYKDVPPILEVSSNISPNKSPNMSPNIPSSNDVLDTTDPNTPLPMRFGPCSCFLDYYVYMKNCLGCYLKDCPDDETAISFLQVANSLDDLVEYNNAKDQVAKAIRKHLIAQSPHHQYLYCYKH